MVLVTKFCLHHKIAGRPLDIGAGIHTGDVQIAGVVNQAAKVQSQARPGKKQNRLHLNPNVRIFIRENREPYL
ncbi:hypothetical protein [Rhizobium sp. CF142]|uniref:hypothetical protein n=1 Tax=Rhizobium sp. CF142 TaxID=1144314 RepID=UPI0002EBF8A0|nr:hypothetical protein [Rhizobium sp. CF142]